MGSYVLFYCIFNLRIIIAVSLLVSLLMVPRTSVQVQWRSKLMPAMYCITHKIIRLSQVISANGARKLFRFRVRQFSGLKYYFTWEITPFRNLFSVSPGIRYIGGPFQAGFTVLLHLKFLLLSFLHIFCSTIRSDVDTFA